MLKQAWPFRIVSDSFKKNVLQNLTLSNERRGADRAFPRSYSLVSAFGMGLVVFIGALSLLWWQSVLVKVQAHDARIPGGKEGDGQLSMPAVARQDARLEGQELVLGSPVKRELAGGEVHSYLLVLSSGQYLHVVVHLKDINVVLTLSGPDGQELVGTDRVPRGQGGGQLFLVTEASGTYRLEVRAAEKEAQSGRYEIRLKELREATEQDRARAAGYKALREGARLGGPSSKVESKRKAIGKYEEALKLFQIAEDKAGAATALTYLGGVYSGIGDHKKAIDYFLQSLPLKQAVGNRAEEAITYSNLGSVHDVLGDKPNALKYHQQALRVWQDLNHTQGKASSFNNLAALYYTLGERQTALDYLFQAWPLFRELADRSNEAHVLNNIGRIYSSLGEKQTALDYYHRALELRKNLGDRRGQATTLNNIGLVNAGLGNHPVALEYLNRSLALCQVLGLSREEAYVLQNIGWVHASLENQQTALDYYHQSLDIRQTVEDRAGKAQTWNLMGRVYAAIGESEKARNAYHRALQLWPTVEDREGEAETRYRLARLARHSGQLSEARAHMAEVLNIVESLRTKVAGPDFRAAYLASKQDYYGFYIDLLMQQHKQRPSEGFDGEGLQVNERARARSLLDMLTESGMDIRQGIDPELLARERALQQHLNAKEQYRAQLLNRKHTPEQVAVVKKEVRDLLTQYQEVRAQIRAVSPRYASLTQPQPLSLREIQEQVLTEDTLLLEYALGEERSYLWAITPTTMTSYELPRRPEIETAARAFYELVSARYSPVRGAARTAKKPRVHQTARYRETAEVLSQMLLGPVAEQIGQKRLLIVSEGALQYVPFAALPSPAPTFQGKGVEKGWPADAAGGRTPAHLRVSTPLRRPAAYIPLMVEHEIVYLPSASTLAMLRRERFRRVRAPKAVAVLADPVFRVEDARVQRITRREQTKTPATQVTILQRAPAELERSARESGGMDGGMFLRRLPYTRQEAERIVALAHPNRSLKALDFMASRTTATSPELRQYRLVHFATHTFLDNIHPELSGIILSQVDKRGRPQDGFLRLHDVYNMNLQAELVVLSACQTALGKDIKGEGLIGLTRGFMHAGVPRVVASLWNVQDVATAELMKRFYEGMLGQAPLRPAAALRAAQMRIWQEQGWEAPYFWAGFILQGEWR